MRKVTVLRTQAQSDETLHERLVGLLAIGLRRFLDKKAASLATAVDFCTDESVTTTCPTGGPARDEESWS